MNIRERKPYVREEHQAELAAFVGFWDAQDLTGHDFRAAVEESVIHWADTEGIALDPRKGFWEIASYYRSKLTPPVDVSEQHFSDQYMCSFKDSGRV